MRELQKDYQLIRDAEAIITGANVHRVNGLIHNYLSVITAYKYKDVEIDSVREAENKIRFYVNEVHKRR